jgi:hypothetical protein
MDVKPKTAARPFIDDPERNSYMETYNSMYQSEKRVKERDDDIFQGCEIKVKFSNFDHSFLKEDGTEFTLLDPFHRPYSYLTVLPLLFRINSANKRRNCRNKETR